MVEARSENVDLWPTVLDLTGLPPLVDPDGRSLVPEIAAAAQGEVSPGDGELAFAQLDQTWGRRQVKPQPLVAVNRGKWRLIYPAAQPLEVELYDKEADPAKQRSLADEHTEVVADLTAVTYRYFESRPPPWGTDAPTVELDEMEMNQLRALGYGVQ